ncbi:MAG: thrombospondin type 3 repeat-containing protein, partial [Myxococcales bacterium]|nr:thrombospondin type 3 repeat-containing protein [Myxococcales bacterium]
MEGRRAQSAAVRLGLVALSAALILTTGVRTSEAQDTFDVQRFRPIPTRSLGYWNATSGMIAPHMGIEAGLLLNYADSPLVLGLDQSDDVAAEIVARQLQMDLVASIGLFDRLEVGLVVPVVLYQRGDDLSLVPSAPDPGAGVGDIRIVPKVLLFSQATEDDMSGFSASFLLNTFIPTGESENFRGEDFRIEPRFALEYGIPTGDRTTRIALNLGYLVRPAADYVVLEVDDAITWSVAASIPIPSIPLSIVPEVSGEISPLADTFTVQESPAEATLGLKYLINEMVLIEAGASLGLGEGYETPLWRGIFGVSYVHRPASDTDGDGYTDDEDGCPEQAEDWDNFEDEDGCPEADNDNDGVMDADDACPLVPEDLDGTEDADGCPDGDNDGDQIVDEADQCPEEPEDFDGFEDTNGCPDPDNDRDGFLDGVDQCPMEAEVMNGFEDEDGCPDEAPVVE